MGKIPKMSGVLRANCFETFGNIPQKDLSRSLPRRIL